MQTHALKLTSVPPSKPAQPVEPVQPVTPVKPASKPVFTPPKPANDPFIGLVSGQAPDPASEIPTGSEPVLPVEPDDGPGWTPRVLDLESAKEDTGPRYLEVDAKGGTVKVSNMAEEDFIEFWCFHVWDSVAAVGSLFGLDLEDICTDEEDREQAERAGRRLYKTAQRSRYLGWMISESTSDAGDIVVVCAFFGGKALAIFKAIQQKKKEYQERKQAQKTGIKPVEPVEGGETAHG